MSNKMKVMVIDDDQGACLFIKKILENTGEIAATTTTDPKTAMDLCLNEKPALIIMDNVMPDIKGGQLVQLLRKNARTKKIPIIMITGKGEMVYLQEKETFEWRPNTQIVRERGELEEQKNHPSLTEAYGVDHYLAKPVNTLKFMEIVNRILVAHKKKEELDEWKRHQ